MKTIQKKIKDIVERYIRKNYAEYCAVCKSIQDSRSVQKNEFATTGRDSYLNQLATIIPETLDNLLQEGLEDEEWGYYKSKKGTEWFAKTYPEFSPIQTQ
jgi:hypothetical protein